MVARLSRADVPAVALLTIRQIVIDAVCPSLEVVEECVGVDTVPFSSDAAVTDGPYVVAARGELIDRELPARQVFKLEPHWPHHVSAHAMSDRFSVE